jgi:hypothetical protein
LTVFLGEGARSISNNWQAGDYKITYIWVLFMVIGALILDALKLGVLWRSFILKVLKDE